LWVIYTTTKWVFERISLSPTPSMSAHWGCHGTEAMAIQFINCTDEICLNEPEVLYWTCISYLFINQFLRNFLVLSFYFIVSLSLRTFRKINRCFERIHFDWHYVKRISRLTFFMLPKHRQIEAYRNISAPPLNSSDTIEWSVSPNRRNIPCYVQTLHYPTVYVWQQHIAQWQVRQFSVHFNCLSIWSCSYCILS
jgi:hypothetical protein